jgi:flavin reductase (DIM6/NTAB) family NADH-FMN oxidoreductase RutF
VSLDPPLLLVCLAKPAASAAALTQASHFAVNVLQTGQQPASIRFSTRDEDRFGTTPWSCGEAGAPILKDSVGVFECERHAVYDGGDHHILVGQVIKASFDASLDPLLYFRGRYRRLHFD